MKKIALLLTILISVILLSCTEEPVNPKADGDIIHKTKHDTA
jgi:hypothetical protein